MSGRPRLTESEKKKMKESLYEILEKMPLVQVACQKVGISRSMFYRWRKEDRDFDTKVAQIINMGRDSINDLAESKMIQNIENGDTRSIQFWLQNNCPRYRKNNPQKEPPVFSNVPPVIRRCIVRPDERRYN